MEIVRKERHNKIYTRKRDILFHNFLGGIAWGVGSVLGATLVVGIIGLAIAKTENIPFIGDVVTTINQEIKHGIDSATVD